MEYNIVISLLDKFWHDNNTNFKIALSRNKRSATKFVHQNSESISIEKKWKNHEDKWILFI